MTCTMRPPALSQAAAGFLGTSLAVLHSNPLSSASHSLILGSKPLFCTPKDLAWEFLCEKRARHPIKRRFTFPMRDASISPSTSAAHSRSPSPPRTKLLTTNNARVFPFSSNNLSVERSVLPRHIAQESVYIRLTPRSPIDKSADDFNSIEYSHAYHVILSLPVIEYRLARCFKTVKEMRTPHRRRRVFMEEKSTFLEEFDSLRDPSYYIASLVLAPGRTPSVSDIMKMGLLGRKKPVGDKLLLPPLRPRDAHKKCLIIDLDETLVHSSFKPVKNPDFVIPVEIDGVIHQVYVLKRPFVDEFLDHVGDKFECVLFTASLAKYADPVADLLDKRGVFRARLFREACVFHKGNYVKDLARLGRDLNKVLIMDNSPASYAFHPENAIAVQTWFDDPHDSELLEVLPLLDRLVAVDSVYSMLRQSESPEPRSDRSSS